MFFLPLDIICSVFGVMEDRDMLALAYSNDTLDIYDNAVCYMFYRFFECGVGMVWARILLSNGFDEDQVSVLFNALKIDEQRSFDYWSASSKLHDFAISTRFQNLNSDLGYWLNKSMKLELIPRYQVRGSLAPMIIHNEPILFSRSTDLVLERFSRNWNLARLFVSKLRDILVAS